MLFSAPEPAGRAAIEDRHLSLDVRFVPKSRRRDFYSIVSVVVASGTNGCNFNPCREGVRGAEGLTFLFA
jgi:hypothetical protein